MDEPGDPGPVTAALAQFRDTIAALLRSLSGANASRD